MDTTLRALGGILLGAVPTFLLVVVLHFYLKHVFFKPLNRVLRARYEATEGARVRAEKSLAHAAAKIAEYEEAMRAARAEIYQAQERLHQQLEEERARHLQAARAEADAAIESARRQLAADAARAKEALGRESEMLAAQIADTMLARSAVA
jgi:F-type H+-transporting ATPase subunit b